MPSRLPSTLLAQTLRQPRRWQSTSASFQSLSPLRILFCGSDEFSIASLRALVQAKQHQSELIGSIDVLHRPAKYTGRGRATLTPVPIQEVATTELSLPTHAVESFNAWFPPMDIDLVIAVSFGLLIPSRILSLSTHGGINVHPSLLPDLRGAAPIERAILNRREHTGVTVQTLHPKHFDRGTVLAQTPAPGIPIPADMHFAALKEQLAGLGASMLLNVLEEGKYRSPHNNGAWYTKSSGPIEEAAKVTKQDQLIDFLCHTVDDAFLKHRALGDTWCFLPNRERLVVHKIALTDKTDPNSRIAGVYVQEGCEFPLLRDLKGGIAMILESTIAGQPSGEGNAKIRRMYPAQAGPYDSLIPDL